MLRLLFDPVLASGNINGVALCIYLTLGVLVATVIMERNV